MFVHKHKQNDWDTKLDKISFAYNTAVHALTKFLPFELMFRRIPKLPIDLVYDQTDSDELRAKIEVASLRASTLYDRTVRGANFKVGDKVWELDQGIKVGSNPKLRPRSKVPYLVHDMFNEVNAILKADGRSRKTNIKHLCKLKRCFGKQPVVAINSREQSVDESSLIRISLDPASPAPNRKGDRGRMACINANTNDSNDALNEHSMAVDGQNSVTTVRQVNEEQDDPMPQLISKSTSIHQEQEQDDAVILKNPKSSRAGVPRVGKYSQPTTWSVA